MKRARNDHDDQDHEVLLHVLEAVNGGSQDDKALAALGPTLDADSHESVSFLLLQLCERCDLKPDSTLIGALLAAGANPNAVDERNDDLLSALHLAALNSSSAAIALLIGAGASVTALSRNGRTPLELCCSGKRWDGQTADVARLLVAGTEVANDLAGYTRTLE
jgi:ankyrin repeat protein